MGDTTSAIFGVSLKMYLDPAATVQWASEVARIARDRAAVAAGTVELFVLPSLPALPAVLEVLRGTGVGVGAQDLHWQDRGAATGGISGADLAQLGCRYAEVHHSERRTVFAEDDAVAAAKLAAAIRNGLTPVICVGEREEATPEEALAACTGQLASLLSVDGANGARVIIAYEPEWAIGAAAAAPVDHVSAVIAGLRSWLARRPASPRASLLYGGSAGPGLLPALGEHVDGLFLGRFAHDPAALERVLDDAFMRFVV